MQKKKGISLIVLVITIIVMIILAATVIISLNNNGIINSAQDAVDKTNEKQVQEIASLAWGEAYADNVGKKEEELLPILKTAVEKALTDNNLNKEDYGMEITTTGVTITKGWLQKLDYTVVKGNKVLEIGDPIEYDATCQGTISGLTDTTWKVLGAENGELLILSDKLLKANLTNWITAESELNELCLPYGKGKNSTGARSIIIDDLYRITGLDKTRFNASGIKYGDKVTIYLDKNIGLEPFYAIKSDGSKVILILQGSIEWYDQAGYHRYTLPDEPLESDIAITTFTSTTCALAGSTHIDLEKFPEKVKSMFFEFDEDFTQYALATSYYGIYDGWLRFGLYYLYGYPACAVMGDTDIRSLPARCVVQLSSDYTPN